MASGSDSQHFRVLNNGQRAQLILDEYSVAGFGMLRGDAAGIDNRFHIQEHLMKLLNSKHWNSKHWNCFFTDEALEFEALEFEALELFFQQEVMTVEPFVKHQHIVDWVWNYFMERSNRTSSSAVTAFHQLRQPIVLSKRSPLYFQHRGQSRTIVGIEKRRRPGVSEEVYLIVLDPSQKTGDIVRTLRDKSGWQRLLKKGLQTLKHAEYQLCYVDPSLATGDEYEKLKVVTSVHYTY